MQQKEYIDQAITVNDENRADLLKGTPSFFRVMAHAASRLSRGAAIFMTPDGRVLRFDSGDGSSQTAIIHIHDWAMPRRTVLGGTIGFYESFADDQWTTPDLSECLFVLCNNVTSIQQRLVGNPFFKIADRMIHLMNKNTKTGSRKNIMAHYDLGNAFYELWLDPTMTYSSARYEQTSLPLDQAQTAKYRSLAQQIDLHADESVLEIGSGWGGFAEFAAKEIGARVTGLTISQEQFDYARQRMQREGLNERVDIRLMDYRDVQGSFDKIASIEMFEAVGKEYWPTYFNTVHKALKPGGLAGLQIITIQDQLYPSYARGVDFIQRYIFPGGMLPGPAILKETLETAGLKLQSSLSFGRDYARTLQEWHKRFLEKWDDIAALGFDNQFKKLWRFYLSYCEAGFRAGTTDVVQVRLSRP